MDHLWQTSKSSEELFWDTLRLAAAHYRPQEPENVVHGLAVAGRTPS